MRTIIAGSRTITSRDVIQRAVETSGIEITEIVSGKARGVDALGEDWARMNNIPVTGFPVTPADWKRYGKRAGYLRNRKMGEYAEALIAVWDGKSRGTKHMIDIADELGLVIKAFIFDEKSGELKEYDGGPKGGSTLPSPAPAKPGTGP